jgi:hypothetical protein
LGEGGGGSRFFGLVCLSSREGLREAPRGPGKAHGWLWGASRGPRTPPGPGSKNTKTNTFCRARLSGRAMQTACVFVGFFEAAPPGARAAASRPPARGPACPKRAAQWPDPPPSPPPPDRLTWLYFGMGTLNFAPTRGIFGSRSVCRDCRGARPLCCRSRSWVQCLA